MTPYKTVRQMAECENTINRSRFISKCFPVKNEDEAVALLASVRAQYPDASHTCYAYRAGERGEAARYSDAGEPSGTAGMPIFEVLRTNGLTNVLVTVTRYFGGILLGTGGLARAYGGGAAEAVKLAGKIERIPAGIFELRVDYPRYGQLEAYIRANAEINELSFTDKVFIRASVASDAADSFVSGIIELSDGRVRPVPAGEGVMEREL